MKERELQNLLRWWPGYEASQMNFKCDQPMGFALFSTTAMAMAARDALQVRSAAKIICRMESRVSRLQCVSQGFLLMYVATQIT